jgi:hypothetical protein
MRLDIEQVGSKDRIAFDFVQYDLTTEMLMAKIQALLADGICFYLIALELVPIVNYDLLNLLMNPIDVVAASLVPILLTVVLYLEDSIRDHFVY